MFRSSVSDPWVTCPVQTYHRYRVEPDRRPQGWTSQRHRNNQDRSCWRCMLPDRRIRMSRHRWGCIRLDDLSYGVPLDAVRSRDLQPPTIVAGITLMRVSGTEYGFAYVKVSDLMGYNRTEGSRATVQSLLARHRRVAARLANQVGTDSKPPLFHSLRGQRWGEGSATSERDIGGWKSEKR
jgi:hypothetical protein